MLASERDRQTHKWKSIDNYFLGMIVIILLLSTVRKSEAELASLQNSNICANWQPETRTENCTRLGAHGALKCFGGMNSSGGIVYEQKVRKLEEIILCGWATDTFDPLLTLQPFPKLRAFTIEHSGFTGFISDFPEMIFLQTINISWTNLSHLATRTFKRLHTLKVLDLRWNQLAALEGPLVLAHGFKQLFLAGKGINDTLSNHVKYFQNTLKLLAGNPWNCTRNFKWLLQSDKGALVTDREDIICTDRKYKERHMLIVMHFKVMLKNECQSHPDLQNCTCQMHHIIPKSHVPLYTVNCSNLQFDRLPSYLPENTTMLFANDNKISDINPLRYNEHYRNVVDIHLDNNRIENIDELENTYWLENFRLLSLRGNLIKKVHVYALDNALEDNSNANILQLSMNPWFCTCKFALRFREFLNKYNDIVRDAWNISCRYNQADDSLKYAKVLAITRQDLCNVSSEEPRIHPIDWLNCILAFLIVLILTKLAYDYYYYKNYGRVPWIVMKLP